MSIAAAVIAQNEAEHIVDCLRSLTWADDILVVDGGSLDNTVALAQSAGARVLTRPFDTFARQRNYAIARTDADWVLFVDADERIESLLAQEIVEAISRWDTASGFWIPRRNMMLGQWVQHGGWWPDEQLRLLRRNDAYYDEHQDPHEVVELDGAAGHLTESILHYNYDSIGEIFARQKQYALREAASLREQGVRGKRRSLISQPSREFFRRYIKLSGYRDGPLGLVLAIAMAWCRLQVSMKLINGDAESERVE